MVSKGMTAWARVPKKSERRRSWNVEALGVRRIETRYPKTLGRQSYWVYVTYDLSVRVAETA